MNILIIGAGALGQVYGTHLAQGGHDVSFLVKPGQRANKTASIEVHQLRRFGSPHSRPMVPRAIYTDIGDTQRLAWDAVWICVPSDKFDETWFKAASSAFQAATIVSISQDIQDKARLLRYWPQSSIVQITPAVFAYQPPLAREAAPSGIAYWIPPGARQIVSGPLARAASLAAALTAGGMKAKAIPAEKYRGDTRAAMLEPLVLGLELADWSWPRFARDTRLAAAAAREAANITNALHGAKPPSAIATSPVVARIAWRFIALLAPFDFTLFLRQHYTKIAGQSRNVLEHWIEEGDSRHYPTSRLQELYARLNHEE
jgi:2-dehydropantoate 2-reductase